MHYETSRTTQTTQARAWQAVTDVEHWPSIIAIYESVRRGEEGPLRVGSTAQIKQKGLRAGTWQVTDMTDHQAFTWESAQPGVRTVARHRLTDEPGGGVRIHLALDQTGWLAGLVGLFLGSRVRSFVDAEADGLAAAAAGPSVGPAAGGGDPSAPST